MAYLIKELHEDRIFEIIRNDIVRGKYKFGEKLDIQKMSSCFGVSRSPVTQAIDRLAHEGLVFIKPHVGSFVFDPTEHDVKEIIQLRTALELCAIELAFSTHDEKYIENMQAELDKVKSCDIEKDPEVFFESDRRFHDSLFVASGNLRLRNTYIALRGQIEIFRISSFSKNAALESAMYHQKILDAIKNKNLEMAKKQLARHIAITGYYALQILKDKTTSTTRRRRNAA